MLRLNNRLLRTDNIVTEFERKVLNAAPPKNPLAPSALAQFQNKLQSIYFKGLDQDQVLEALSSQDRFQVYPYLQAVLKIIFTLNENSNLSEALSALKKTQEEIEPEWDAPHLEMQWEALDKKYGYFSQLSSEQQNQYKALFRQLTLSCRKIAVLFEENNTSEDTMAYDYAYKLMAIYTDPEQKIAPNFDEVAKAAYKLLNQSDVPLTKPFHDVLLVQLTLPQKKDVSDFAGWRRLINKVGPGAFSFFAMASQIEQKIHESTGELRAPKDRREAAHYFARIKYKRAGEDLNFAILCHENKYPEAWFNVCLDYMQEPPGWPKKTEDNIPEIDIEGEGVSAGFRLQKLPTDDKRALILGETTGCCQSIGRESEQCVRDGTALSDNGFYVITKNGPDGKPIIIAQTYAWRSERGNLCLDSIEYSIGRISEEAIQDMLSKFAREILKREEIKVVTLGCGGRTPENLFPEAPIPEMMKQGTQYGDSITQYLVMGQAQLKDGYAPLPSDIGSDKERALFEYIRHYEPSHLTESDFREFIQGRFAPTRLPMFLRNARECINVLASLSSKEARLVVYASIKQQLPSFIEHIGDLIKVMELLAPKERADLYKRMEEKLPKIMRHITYNFLGVLELLAPKERAEFFEYMKDKLLGFIPSIFGFRHLISHLVAEEQLIVYESVQEKLLGLVRNAQDFSNVLECLVPELRKIVYESMKEKLGRFIQCPADFMVIMRYLAPKEQAEFCERVKEKLHGFIESPSALKIYLGGFNKPMQTQFIAFIKGEIADAIIRNSVPSHTSRLESLGYLIKQSMVMAYEIGSGVFNPPSEVKPPDIYYIEGIDQMKLSKAIQEYAAVLTSEQIEEVIGALKERLPEGFDLESGTSSFLDLKAGIQGLRTDKKEGSERKSQPRGG